MDYRIYEGKDKDERKKTASADLSLELKRFLYPKNPEVAKKLKFIKEAFEEFKARYPEVISLGLFGSAVKGYAIEKSDIDGILFVEADTSPGNAISFYDAKLVQIFTEKLGKDYTRDKTIRLEAFKELHLSTHFINEEGVKNTIVNLASGGSPQKLTELAYLFLLRLGGGIMRYRQIVFEELKKMGPEGEKNWREIMGELCEFENKGLDAEMAETRKSLYPKTLAEGRKIFLKKTAS